MVHGADGLDELSTTAPTTVLELRSVRSGQDSRTSRRRSSATPSTTGRPGASRWRAPPSTTCGEADAADNAEVVRSVLGGEHGGATRDIVVLNAAAGTAWWRGSAPDLAEGVQTARSVIDEGECRKPCSTAGPLTGGVCEELAGPPSTGRTGRRVKRSDVPDGLEVVTAVRPGKRRASSWTRSRQLSMRFVTTSTRSSWSRTRTMATRSHTPPATEKTSVMPSVPAELLGQRGDRGQARRRSGRTRGAPCEPMGEHRISDMGEAPPADGNVVPMSVTRYRCTPCGNITASTSSPTAAPRPSTTTAWGRAVGRGRGGALGVRDRGELPVVRARPGRRDA